ncbi:DoxX family protein [Brevibacterium litoralis]|uniref:DoxX family protein n=1 Tax=Brevibacterium litoralis TaxID=3138935 RepID=UPI0032EE2CC0
MNASAHTALALVRIVTGIVMFMHGLQKVTVYTIPGFQQVLAGMDFPAATLAGAVFPWVEIVVGIILVLGLGVRVAGAVTALSMLVALFTMHLSAGFYADAGGYEFVLVLAVIGLALAISGGGKAGVDAALTRTKAGSTGASDEAARKTPATV